jgi:CubicO group peptidase (beta-lactamase class C family)
MESLTMFLILILISIITVIALLLAYVFWWFKPPIDRGNFAAIETHILQSLNRAMGHNLANAALVLIQNSEVTATHCLGIANIETQAPVTLDHTLHQLASVSKVVTAWGVMKLVEQGQLSLDEPVQNRLTRWQFPPSEYRDRVTVRHLLSHTAGLDDMFGYNGFLPDETPQTL